MNSLFEIVNLLMHRYIRTGDRLRLYRGDKEIGVAPARVSGFGRFATVYAGSSVIRRDGIHRDAATGEWVYHLEGE